jgi:hypothetical protein
MGKPDALDRLVQILFVLPALFSLVNGGFMVWDPYGWYIEDKELSSNRLVSFGFRAVYRSRLFNKLIYPLQGFAAHKGAFCGSTEQTYCAFKRGLALSQLVKMPRACNL